MNGSRKRVISSMEPKRRIQGLATAILIALLGLPTLLPAAISPVAMLCPCSFEPENQTHGIAKFSIVFNEEVAASEALRVEFVMLSETDLFFGWQELSRMQLESLEYQSSAQAVEVRLPTYVFSGSATGYPALRLTNAVGDTFYDGVILSTTESVKRDSYGLWSINNLVTLFLSQPEFAVTDDVVELRVSEIFVPSLANQTEELEISIRVGDSEGSSFYPKGSGLVTVVYNDEGVGSLVSSIRLDTALDSHLVQDPSFTNVQMAVKREDAQILSYWLDSLANDVAPNIGVDLTAPDTLKDFDGDGLSDFNEALLGSDPEIQDAPNVAQIELAYTYGKTVVDRYGDDLDARMLLLHEAAKAVFTESGVPVELIDLQRINVGDDSNMDAETLIDQLEQRSGLFLDLDSKFNRNPDLIIHFGLEQTLEIGGLANLQGALGDGIIASAAAFASGFNVGVVGIDGVDELTLPHELGHLMGLVHSRAQGDADGAFPWARGYGLPDTFVTTMGYSSAFNGAPYVGYFSSPNLACSGEEDACGVPRSDFVDGADAVLTLTTTAPQIAAISNGYSPVLTIVGDNPATVESEAEMAELSATATDAEDGNLTSDIATTLNLAAADAEGHTHLHTYRVTDSDGNSQSATRKINLALTVVDTDGDGVRDSLDAFPEDPSETKDSDGDGVGDNADAFPNNAAETLDSDGDGLGDNADTDDDGDGFTDLEEEAAGTDPFSAGSCPGCFSWDIDGDGEAKALTDGLLVIRHLFGFSGEALTTGAVGQNASRSEAAAIAGLLDEVGDELDIDGNDETGALTDGLLLIRGLFGFSGEALIAGAVGSGAERFSAAEILTYVTARLPGEGNSDTGNNGGDDDGPADGGDGGAADGADDTGSGTDTGSGSTDDTGGGAGTGSGGTDDAGSGTDTGSGAADDTGGGMGTDSGATDDAGSGTDTGSGSTDDTGGGTDTGSGSSDDSGGGADAGSGTDGGSDGETSIRVDVVYDRVPYCNSGCSGLDYDRTRQDPVRFAKAEILDASTGEVLKAGLVTSESGRLSFQLSDTVGFKVRVYAESTGNGIDEWGLRVVDNGGSDSVGNYPVYSLESTTIQVADVSDVISMRASSGWSGTSYAQTRSAAPFAIMDSMITGTLYALSGRAGLSFDPIDVYWSTENSTDNVGTSFFSGSYIMILGDAGADTDEYDESIVIHEWGHYFQSILSRDDSVGGPHGSGDLLDMRVAFSEGWANALSGLAAGTTRYQDTLGPLQAGGFSFSLEVETPESAGAVKGWYSEDSVQNLVFDLFDAGENDDDSITLPASAMMDTLIDYMPAQTAATSIFAFGSGLISAESSRKDEILSLFAGENIAANRTDLDSFGEGETNSGEQYTSAQGIAELTLPIYRQIPTSLELSSICQDAVFGPLNKLGNYSFARFSVPTTGTYTVRVSSTVSPMGATPDPDFGVFNASGLIGPSFAELTFNVGSEVHDLALTAGDYWLWVQDYNNFVANGTNGRYCQRLEITQ